MKSKDFRQCAIFLNDGSKKFIKIDCTGLSAEDIHRKAIDEFVKQNNISEDSIIETNYPLCVRDIMKREDKMPKYKIGDYVKNCITSKYKRILDIKVCEPEDLDSNNEYAEAFVGKLCYMMAGVTNVIIIFPVEYVDGEWLKKTECVTYEKNDWDKLVEKYKDINISLKDFLTACKDAMYYDIGRYMPWRYIDILDSDQCNELDRAMVGDFNEN